MRIKDSAQAWQLHDQACSPGKCISARMTAVMPGFLLGAERADVFGAGLGGAVALLRLMMLPAESALKENISRRRSSHAGELSPGC